MSSVIIGSDVYILARTYSAVDNRLIAGRGIFSVGKISQIDSARLVDVDAVPGMLRAEPIEGGSGSIGDISFWTSTG